MLSGIQHPHATLIGFEKNTIPQFQRPKLKELLGSLEKNQKEAKLEFQRNETNLTS